MTRRWCAVCFAVLAALCPLVGGVVAWAAGEPAGGQGDFHTLLAEARAAYDAGDQATARARLRQATRLTSDDEFHALLADAADQYETGGHPRARALLKRATRELNPWFWLILGFVAQAMFIGRFAVQWIASERRGESVVPVSFWYLSLLGSWGLLAYAIWRQDAVIICGMALNSIIYVRNLMLIYRKRGRADALLEEEAAA